MGQWVKLKWGIRQSGFRGCGAVLILIWFLIAIVGFDESA
jgi:hypothetical protein